MDSSQTGMITIQRKLVIMKVKSKHKTKCIKVINDNILKSKIADNFET